MSAIRIVAVATLTGTPIATATATSAAVVGAVVATVETGIEIRMDGTAATGVTDVARHQVDEVDDTHPIMSTGAAEVTREALLGEVVRPEVDVIMMLLPQHPLRPLPPTRLRRRDGEQHGYRV